MQHGHVWCYGMSFAAFASSTERHLSLALHSTSTSLTPVLCNTLHWLPIAQCIVCKIALMMYSCMHGTRLAYFHDISHPVASIEGHAMLRSTVYRELIKSCTKGKCYGPCSFHVAAPTIWNTHTHTHDLFKALCPGLPG